MLYFLFCSAILPSINKASCVCVSVCVCVCDGHISLTEDFGCGLRMAQSCGSSILKILAVVFQKIMIYVGRRVMVVYYFGVC